MTTNSIFKQLSTASATTFLVFAMGNISANAAQYKISGQFGSEFTMSYGFVDVYDSVYHGSFEGTLEFDDLDISSESNITLDQPGTAVSPKWSINLLNGKGKPQYFLNSLPQANLNKRLTKYTGTQESSILISEQYVRYVTVSPYRYENPGFYERYETLYSSALLLYFDQPNYAGNIAASFYHYTFSSFPYGATSYLIDAYGIDSIQGYSERLLKQPVPEPTLILGLGTVMTGMLLKNKRQLRKV